jgi:hypothetical protein
LSGSAAKLTIVHAIHEPQVIYDIFDLIHRAPEETRTIMRSVIKSPVKLVAHRGSLSGLTAKTRPTFLDLQSIRFTCMKSCVTCYMNMPQPIRSRQVLTIQ